MAEDAYGNPVTPVTETEIDQVWGAAATERIVATYPSDAARDTLETGPVTGRLCYVSGTGELQVYDGSEWKVLAAASTPDVVRVGSYIDGSIPSLTTSYAVLASTSVSMPTGWTSARVLVQAIVQYGAATAGVQLQTYVEIDGNAGSAVQAGVTIEDGDPISSPVHVFETSEATIDIDVYGRSALTETGATGKYISLTYVLLRTA